MKVPPMKALLVTLLLIAVSVTGCLDDGDDENQAPIADAGPDMTSRPYKEVGKPIEFSAKASTDPDGDDLEYSWDFDADDGSTEDEDRKKRTVLYTYFDPGTYTVTLTVSDGYTFDTDSLKVKVVDPPGELTADLQTDDETQDTLHEGETAEVDLDGSNSVSTETDIIKYEWDLSYNYSKGFEADEDTGQDDSLRHDFPSGMYGVMLRVTNTTDHIDESQVLWLYYNYNQSKQDSIGTGSHFYDLPINTLYLRWIRIRLQYHDGGLGINNDDLDVHLFDADDNEVAKNDTHDEDNRYQINEILLEATNTTHLENFDDEDEMGEWKVEVRHRRSWGDDPNYKLFMDVVYYED